MDICVCFIDVSNICLWYFDVLKLVASIDAVVGGLALVGINVELKTWFTT